ncbi:MAG TPA: hypothetical protein VKA01_10565 [Vicinamibacteria bacterium]|nr:hypothetical protein [Vicinamibacteria bacterium]
MVEVNVTDDFRGWYEGLTAEEQGSVAFVVGLLEEKGVTLGYPYSSVIEGSKVAMR